MSKAKFLTRDKLENFGSLITLKGTQTCLGSLMVFSDVPLEQLEAARPVNGQVPRGVWDPNHGQVPVTKVEAEAHNKALDQALLEGLDANCQVGQGSSFYLSRPKGEWHIATFLGTPVATSQDITVNGRSVTFQRKGKTYRGRMSLEYDLFNFRRVK